MQVPGRAPNADSDPFIWLEDFNDDRTQDWVRSQRSRAELRFFDKDFERRRDDLSAILESPEEISFPYRWGKWIYNFWTSADNPRGLWRRATIQSYQSENTRWDIILDVDKLAEKEGEDWVWFSFVPEVRRHGRVILMFSRGGADATVQREFDMRTRRFVADGFILPESKSHVVWIDRNNLLLLSPLGEGMANNSGYARTVRLWRRGTDPLAAPIIFETKESSLGGSAYWDWDKTSTTRCKKRFWFYEDLTDLETAVWYGDLHGPREQLDIPSDAVHQVYRDWLLIQPRSAWHISGKEYVPGGLYCIKLSKFLAGERTFISLYEPRERCRLEHYFWCADRLVLSTKENMCSRSLVAEYKGSEWSVFPLDSISAGGDFSIYPLDLEYKRNRGYIIISSSGPLSAPKISILDIAQDVRGVRLLKSAPDYFSTSGLVVTRHETISTDGEAIPYTQIGPAGLSGDAPVCMSGYGGFELPWEAGYDPIMGKLWLEEGGTVVVAQIRGGGEFGPQWHNAGRREGKIQAHDDFAAIASDLVCRGVTHPGRIAAQGASNGGLLIANMLTRYPERFGALLCEAPLTDMKRFNKLLAGASWVPEYGDPDAPEDWDYLKRLSAYHVAEAGRPYPPILLTTTTCDDRVHPGHARKMAAKLLALGHEAYLYEVDGGGHGCGRDAKEHATHYALCYSFLRRAIGWTRGRTTGEANVAHSNAL